MARPTVELADFSGVDGRSSPLRLPPGKALRCVNWVPAPNGVLQLRYGYTRPFPDVNFPGQVHSSAYVEPNSGTPYVLGGFSASVGQIGVSASFTNYHIVGTLSNPNPWNGIFADNKFMFGNAQDAMWFDGTTLRYMGVRSPSTTEAASVSVSYSTAATGTWGTTLYSGYQLFMCYYNPVTQECGNRIAIGTQKTIGTANGVMVITGLPNLGTINSEWVKLLGRTNDNGQVPNAFIGSDGNYVVCAGTASTATILMDTTDPESELPTRNGLPPRFDKIAWALSRAYAIDEDDPTSVRYSESQADVPSGLFVGDSRTSWAASSKIYFPTGERCRGIHGIENTVWVWTHNHLGILNELSGQDSGLGRPTIQWMGTWVGGIAGQRAFAMTRYGPFWVSAEKQLMTRGESGPVAVSAGYESALLGRIADANVAGIEVTYLLDPAKDIDCLYIWGKDGSGNDVVVIHDFGAGGIGREYSYTGIVLSTFVCNRQTIVSARDVNSKMRLWAISTDGYIDQLEDGDVDGTSSTYSADIITVFNAGPMRPTLGAIEFFGDKNIRMSVTDDLTLTLNDLSALPSLETEQVDEKTSLYKVHVEQRRQYYMLRVQLDSHPADGTLAPSSPVPHVPLETYGRLYLSRPEMGAPRPIGGSNP